MYQTYNPYYRVPAYVPQYAPQYAPQYVTPGFQYYPQFPHANQIIPQTYTSQYPAVPMTYNPHKQIQFPKLNKSEEDEENQDDEQPEKQSIQKSSKQSSKQSDKQKQKLGPQEWIEKIPYTRKKTVVRWVNNYQQAPLDEFSDDEVHIKHTVEFVVDPITHQGYVPIQTTQVVRPEYQYPPGYYEYADKSDSEDHDE